MTARKPNDSSSSQFWHDALRCNQLSEGSVVEAIVDDEVLVIGLFEGKYFALDGVCAHQGGPLGRGALEGCTLTCPWHGWQYDIRTGRQLLSEHIKQSVYATRVVGDTIQVCKTPDTSG